MKRFQILVEGKADIKFVSDYFYHVFREKAPKESIIHPGNPENKEDKETSGGYTMLTSEVALGAMRLNTDQGGINIVIFDADKDIEKRRAELLSIKKKYDVEFELFLLPNDQEPGALEDLLERIINPDNQPVMDCWAKYEEELGKVRIPTKMPPTLTIPAKKTKIYAYLETLLGESLSQKKLIKDPYREYENSAHWNLNADYLNPLKAFLTDKIG